MKTIFLAKPVIFILLLLGMASLVEAQDTDKAKAIKELVASRHFMFRAQTMMPMGRGAKQLTSDYDLKIKGDTLIAYLPYFGRAYTPILPGEGGINFTATDFDYTSKKKKNRWQVTIRPKDTRDVRQLYLTIEENGYAQLQVTSNNRQPISYSGIVVGLKD